MAVYKVTNFNEVTGQLTIEFAVGMSPMSIDVPIKNGLYITGEELETYIQGFIPTWHIERIAQINAGVANKAELINLVENTATEVELPAVITAEQEQARQYAFEQAQIRFEKDVAKVLVKFGVLTSDPSN